MRRGPAGRGGVKDLEGWLPAGSDLLDALPGGVLVISADGRVLHANPEAGALLGETSRRLTGADLAEITGTGRLVDDRGLDLDPSSFPAVAALREGQASTHTIGLKDDSGAEPHWLRVSARPFASPDGGSGVLCTVNEMGVPPGTQRRLWRRLNHLRGVLNSLPDAYLLLDRTGQMLECSGHALALAEEAGVRDPVGRWFGELLAGHEPEVRQALAEALADGESRFELEWRGGETTAYWEARLTLVADGRVSVLLRDISDRWRAEEELVALGERYRLVVDNARDVIFRMTLRPSARLDYISPSVERLVGYTPGELYADSTLLYRIPRRDFLATVQRAAQGVVDFSTPVELCMIHKDGHEVWVEQTLAAGRGPDGSLLTLDGVMRDITRRREQTEALRESELRFRLLADHARDVAWHVSLSPSLRVDYVSPSVTRLLGYAPEELKREGVWRSVVAPPSQALVAALMAGEMDDDTPLLVAWRHRDGGTVWTRGPAVLVRDERGEPSALQGLARDVTAVIQDRASVKAALDGFRLLAEALNAADSTDGAAPALELIVRRLAAAAGLLVLAGPGRNRWAVRASDAGVERLAEEAVHDEELADRVVASGRCERGSGRPPGEASGGRLPFLAVPLAVGTATIGCLALWRRTAFGEEECELLRSLGVHLAPVLRSRSRGDEREDAPAPP